MKRTLLFALMLVLGLGRIGAADAQEAYVIGATGAMTGPAAANFAPVLEAMKAYLDNLNARGGVNGKPVQMIVQDDSGEPSKAAANVKKLIAQDRVLMLVSSSPSSTYAPLVVESKRAGVPLYYAGAVCPKETYPPAPNWAQAGHTPRSLSSMLAICTGRPVWGSGIVRGAAAREARRPRPCDPGTSSKRP